MKRLVAFIMWIYRRLLALYPAPFRNLYAEEMEEVFRQELEECAARKPGHTVLVLLREMFDLPANLLDAYRNQRAKMRYPAYAMASKQAGGFAEPASRRISMARPFITLLYASISLIFFVFCVPLLLLAVSSQLPYQPADQLNPLGQVLLFVGAIFIFVPSFLISHFFLSHTAIYLCLSILGIVLGGFGIWNRSSRTFFKGLSILLVIVVFSFPFVFRYQPALVAAGSRWPINTDDYRIINATEPTLLEGVVKAAQALGEGRGHCTYQIVGWDQSNHLYYQADCQGELTSRVFAPTHEVTTQLVHNLTTQAHLNTIREQQSHSHLQLPKTTPTLQSDQVLYDIGLRLKSAYYTSPDQRWTAVVSQHIYGPQDVVVFTAKER